MLSHLFLRYTYLIYVQKSLKYKEYDMIKDLSFPELPPSLQEKLSEEKVELFLQKELSLCNRHHFHLIEYVSSEYPSQLKMLKSMPPCLYVNGLREPLSKNGIAIVGSRKASPYGLKQAYAFGREIALRNAVVISGLAYGIDTKAHEGCLDGQGLTVAVVGNGLDTIYPPSNASLHQKIVNQGCVMSEFPLLTPPHKYNFPVRNRIISGLAQSLLVVEASEKSGALITVDYALDQGKEVYAIPGNIDSVTSQGTNRLIKNGAILIDSVSTLFQDEVVLFPKESHHQSTPTPTLNSSQNVILSFLSERDASLDQIVERLHEPIQNILQALSVLELLGLVKKIQQNYTLQR